MCHVLEAWPYHDTIIVLFHEFHVVCAGSTSEQFSQRAPPRRLSSGCPQPGRSGEEIEHAQIIHVCVGFNTYCTWCKWCLQTPWVCTWCAGEPHTRTALGPVDQHRRNYVRSRTWPVSYPSTRLRLVADLDQPGLSIAA